jgi:hypothetical protein
LRGDIGPIAPAPNGFRPDSGDGLAPDRTGG